MKNHSYYPSVYSNRFQFGKKRNEFPGHGKYLEDGFTCNKCGFFVTANSDVSGVKNRNHCPCCLWSRHLDLFKAGDRLSACKALMKPIGLTAKRNGKKYGTGCGELMVVHQCICCGTISINRIAADDIPQTLLEVLDTSPDLVDSLKTAKKLDGIRLLSSSEANFVQVRLFGRGIEQEEAQPGS
jgi:hypothetical protein